MKDKHITWFIILLFAVVWVVGQLTADSRKEAEEAYERQQKLQQGIAEVYQEAVRENTIYHNFGDI